MGRSKYYSFTEMHRRFVGQPRNLYFQGIRIQAALAQMDKSAFYAKSNFYCSLIKDHFFPKTTIDN